MKGRIPERNRFAVLFVLKHSRLPLPSAVMRGHIRERNRFAALLVLEHLRMPQLFAVMEERIRERKRFVALFVAKHSRSPVISAVMKGRIPERNLTSSSIERYILLRASRDLPSHPITSSGIEGYILLRASRGFIFIENRIRQLLWSGSFLYSVLLFRVEHVASPCVSLTTESSLIMEDHYLPEEFRTQVEPKSTETDVDAGPGGCGICCFHQERKRCLQPSQIMEGKTMPVGFVVKSSSIRASYGDTSELTLGKNLSAVPSVPRRSRSMRTCEDMNYFIRERNRFVVLFVMKHSRSPVISADMKGRIPERNRFAVLLVSEHSRIPLLSAVMKGPIRERKRFVALFVAKHSRSPVISAVMKGRIPERDRFAVLFVLKHLRVPLLSVDMKGRIWERNPSSAVFAQWVSLVPVTSSGTERYILLRASRDLPSHPITSSGIEGCILLRANTDLIFIENRIRRIPERDRFAVLFVLKHLRVPLLSAVMKGPIRERNPSSAVFAQRVSLVPVTSSGTERYILLRASRDLPSHPITSSGIEGYILLRANTDLIFIENRIRQLLWSGSFLYSVLLFRVEHVASPCVSLTSVINFVYPKVIVFHVVHRLQKLKAERPRNFAVPLVRLFVHSVFLGTLIPSNGRLSVFRGATSDLRTSRRVALSTIAEIHHWIYLSDRTTVSPIPLKSMAAANAPPGDGTV
ncbi:unnamed protein product [Cyprideis torosa]|uniref:Uncharacterized protein n=1 Tax=Cyprideis torosa TaxID=163714 RepID=A0A7R8WK98_9CRUS|nr:unnamed protein product [Cyprideis torosa]CAG0896688.1 unnamed protein product [Cyprideis torosa]